MRTLLILAALFVLCACSNTVSSLHYVPTRTVQASSVASVGAVTVVDQRKEAPARLATIMGGLWQSDQDARHRETGQG